MSDTFIRSSEVPLSNDTMHPYPFFVDRPNCRIRYMGNFKHEVISKASIETVNICCGLIFRKGLHSYIDINQMFSQNQKLNPENKKNFKNPLELRTFLIQYPEIFIIDKDRISLKNPNVIYDVHINWIKTLLENDFPRVNNSVINAIQFYSDILYQNKFEYFPLSQLVTHKNKAKEDVQLIAGNPAELKAFLVAIPQIFLVLEDKVKLQDAALQQKCNYYWLEKCICDERGEAIISLKAVEYYLNILSTYSPNYQVPILNLFRFRELASKDIQELTKTEEDFMTFISNYTDVFSLCDGMIKPVDLLFQLFKKESKWKKKHDDKLKMTNDNLCKRYLEILKTNCLIEVPLQYLIEEHSTGIKKKDKLKSFLFNYPEYFIIKHDKVIYKPFYFRINDKKCGSGNCETLFKLSSENVDVDINNDKLKISMFCLWILHGKVGMGIDFPFTRLKVYLDLILIDHKVNSTAHLRSLLNKFTDFLIIRYSTVTLKNNASLDKLFNGNKYIEKYSKYEKLYFIESYSITQGINFYSSILKKNFCNFEVPIKYIFGYRSLASLEVMALAKSPDDLNNFFSAHPDIFNVRDDRVSLSKTNFSNEKEEDFEFDEVKGKVAIQFYASIIKKLNIVKCPIVILFGYRYLAPEAVRDLIKTCWELKSFLSHHPEIFSINNDDVVLESQLYGNSDLFCTQQECCRNPTFNLLSLSAQFLQKTSKNKSKDLERFKTDAAITGLKYKQHAVIGAVLFFSNIMFKKGPTSEHNMSYLISFRNGAAKEIQEITKDAKKIRLLLSRFPKIFSINYANDTIKLVDMATYYKNQRKWIKELLPKYHYSTTNHETIVSGIQFYSDIITEKTSKNEIALMNLFSYRKTSLDDVQNLAKNIGELKNFLSMFPEIFTINGEKISLRPEAMIRKMHPKWIEDLLTECNIEYENIDSDRYNLNETSGKISLHSDVLINSSVPAKENPKTMKAIDFFTSILRNDGRNKTFTCEQLFQHKNLAPPEVKEFLTSPLALKDFFMKHPNIFFVKNEIVKIFIPKYKEKNSEDTNKKNKKVKSFDSHVSVKNSTSYKPVPINSNERDLADKGAINNPQYKTVNTILFYLDILCRKGPHLNHSISNLFCHQSKAVIGYETFKNPKELQAFLSRYDKLFAVNHEQFSVTITDLALLEKYQKSWIKEILPKYHSSIANHETIVSTIQFYSNIIFEKSSRNELDINYLFSHRSGALEHVKNVAKNVKELYNFLLTYPEIFSVNSDKVSLTSSALSRRILPKWIEEIAGGFESSETEVKSLRDDKIEVNLEENKNKKVIRKAVQFCYGVIRSNISNNGFSLKQLISHLNYAPSDVQEIISNVSELNSLLSKFRHIFTVIDDAVFLTSYCDK